MEIDNIDITDEILLFWEDDALESVQQQPPQSGDNIQQSSMEFKREPSTSVQADMISEVVMMQNQAVSQTMQMNPCSTLQLKAEEVVVKQEFPEGPPAKRKSKNASLSFDKSGKARIRVGGRWQPLSNDLTQLLEAEMNKAMDERREETSQHGIIYDELLQEAEKHRGRNLRDLDVGATRKLCTRYRKLLFLTPEDIQGKDKIKFLWSTKPREWPEGLLHVDPNNARAAAPGDAGKKPNKEQLLPMVQYMQRLYEEKRDHLIGNFHGRDSRVKAEIRQNVAPSPPTMAVHHSKQERDSDKIRQLIEAVMKFCPTSRDMMRTVYEEIWGRAGEIVGGDASCLQVLKQLQDEVVAYLKLILVGYKHRNEPIEFKFLRENLKQICEPKLSYLRMRREQNEQGRPVQVKQEQLSPPIMPMTENLPMPIPQQPPAQMVSMSPTRSYPSTIDLGDMQSAGLTDNALNSQAMVDHDYYEHPLKKLRPTTQMEVLMDHEYSQKVGGNTGPVVTPQDLADTLSQMSAPVEAVPMADDQILGTFTVDGLPEEQQRLLFAALDAANWQNIDTSNVMMSTVDPMMSDAMTVNSHMAQGQAGRVQQQPASQAGTARNEPLIPTFINNFDDMSMDF